MPFDKGVIQLIGKLSKFLSNTGLVFGLVVILLAFADQDLHVAMRAIYIIMGITICLIAKVAKVRWTLLCITSVILMVSGVFATVSGEIPFGAAWILEFLLFGILAIIGFVKAGFKLPRFMSFSQKRTHAKTDLYPEKYKSNDSKNTDDAGDTVNATDALDAQDVDQLCQHWVPISDPVQERNESFATDLKNRNKIYDDSFFIVCKSDEEFNQFLQIHPFVEEIRTKVAGVSYQNDDGTSRQEILSRCRAGDPVFFIPYTFDDAPAIAVHSKYGQIGNLRKELAESIECDYDCDLILSGTITEITGGTDGLYYGCNLHINCYKA